MRVGTVIRRRNTHFETPIEGTMEVMEYEPNQAFGLLIRDGPQEKRGRVTFQEDGQDRTRVGIAPELQGLDESNKPLITTLVERSARKHQGTHRG